MKKAKKTMTTAETPRAEAKGGPLPPEQFRANNIAVFNEVKRRSELQPGNPEYLRLSPISLRALELYTTEISLIPRGPHDTEGMVSYFQDYAERFNENSEHKQKLTSHVDDASNVHLRLEASGGDVYEELPEIQFQGHYDMVCDAKEGYPNPAQYGVALELTTHKNKQTGRDELWMQGQGTSVGIDCAWGVALALAKLEAVSTQNGKHPALGVFITRDEEVGLLGAKAFSFTREQLIGNKPTPSEWYLLNIDNDNLNGLVGSAGLVGSEVSLPTEREVTMPKGFTRLSLSVLGTQAGHSGDERDRIGNGRWNKITEAAEMLQALQQVEGLEDLRLIAIDGGHADNAIPMAVKTLVIAVPQGHEDEVISYMQQMAQTKNQQAIQDLARFATDRPARAEDDEADVMEVKRVEESEKTQQLMPMTTQATKQTLRLLETLNPNGVLAIEWDPKDPEAIETSSNLSLLRTDQEGITITILSRSSQENQLSPDGIRATAIRHAVEAVGAIYTDAPDNSGDPWEPDFSDPIVMLQQQAAARVLPADRKFKVTTIHAGVEVKTLRDRFTELFGPEFILHATSNGPKYKGAHSFQERAPLESMEEFAQFESALVDEIIAYELAKQERSFRRSSAAA